MTTLLRSSLSVLAIAIGVSACGNGNSGSPTPTTPVTPPAAAKIEDQFGTACFAPRFRADPNTKATDPVPCPDLPPVTLTAKPLAF